MKAIVFVAIGASDVLKVKEDWAELNLPANEVHAEIDCTGVATHGMRLSDKTSTKDAPERPSCFMASLPCHSFAMRMKSGKMTGYSACPRTSSRVKHCDSELMPVQPWEAHIRRSDGRGWMLWWCRRYGAGRGPSHSKCLRC